MRNVAFRFLGTVELDYNVVTRMAGSVMIGICVALMPCMIGVGGD